MNIFKRLFPETKQVNKYLPLDNRDVLIGTVKSKGQFYSALNNKFYHIPAFMVSDHPDKIRYVALYQSVRQWGNEACIKYYGEVVASRCVHRDEIQEWYDNSNEEYIRYDVREWKTLVRPLHISENMIYVCEFTNFFLLTHSFDATQLLIQDENTYKLSQLLIDGTNDFRINDVTEEYGFEFEGYSIRFNDGSIKLFRDNRYIASYSASEYIKKPGTILNSISEYIK